MAPPEATYSCNADVAGLSTSRRRHRHRRNRGSSDGNSMQRGTQSPKEVVERDTSADIVNNVQAQEWPALKAQPTQIRSSCGLKVTKLGAVASARRQVPQAGAWKKHMPTVVEDEEYDGSESVNQTASSFPEGAEMQPAQPRTEFNQLGEPLSLIGSPENCSKVVALLEAAPIPQKKQIVEWLLEKVYKLAMSENSCRVIQKVLEVASGSERERLVAQLEDHPRELYESPHGNYVLTRAIEVMPPATLRRLIANLQEQSTLEAARHRFGCRALERLIEHCPEDIIGGILDEVVEDAAALSQHPYGNFVVQHLFEHGESRRQAIMAQIADVVPQLARDRTASHVLEKVLEYGDEDIRRQVQAALFCGEGKYSLVEVTCNRYGSFVVEKLAGLSEHAQLNHELRQRLRSIVPQLQQNQFGQRVIENCGLLQATTCTNLAPDVPEVRFGSISSELAAASAAA